MLKCLVKYVLMIVVVAVSIKQCYAVDPVFSQFYTASMFLNPALASELQGVNGTFNNRTLTNRQYGRYNLNQGTVIYPFKLTNLLYKTRVGVDHRSGLGVSFYREGTGDESQLNTTGLVASMAHRIQLAKEYYLALGIQGGFVSKKIKGNFNWGTEYNPDIGYDPTIVSSVEEDLKDGVSYPLVNVGMVFYYNASQIKEHLRTFNFDAFLGVSFYNVNTPNQSFFESNNAEVPLQMKVHGGFNIPVSSLVEVSPTYLWVQQNGNNQVNFGSYVSIKGSKIEKEQEEFTGNIGVWYRWGDSFIFLIGSKIRTVTIGLSYDFNTQSVFTQGRGIFELSLKYEIPPKKEILHRGLLYPSLM